MEELLKAGRTVRYKKGEILIRPSDFGRELFILNSGMVRTYTIDKTGRENLLTIYGPGEVFPIVWIIQKEPLSVFFDAMINCEAVRVSTDNVLAILKSDSNSSFAVLERVIRQFVLYAARVDNLGYKFARDRIAYHVLLLGKRFGKTHGDKVVLPRFSQDEIGSATNVSRESVSRELKRFEKLGYIMYAPGELQILNVGGLHKELVPANGSLFIDDL